MSEGKNTALAAVPPQTNGGALAVRDDRLNPAAFEPSTFAEAWKLAQVLSASGLLPKAVQRPEAAVAIIITGRELGLSAMKSLRSIHVIEGKPSLSAALKVALVKQSPDCEYFRLVESTDKIATYITKRRGELEPTKLSFTIAEAQAAGVTGKDNWRKYAPAMLRARCSSALCDAVYPDVTLNLYDPDEIEALPPRSVNTPPEETPHNPTTGEVIESLRPPPLEVSRPPAGQPGAMALEERIANAKTQEELGAVAKAINTAKAYLTDADQKVLRDSWRDRKNEIAAEVAKAAQPEPPAAEDGDEPPPPGPPREDAPAF